MKLKYIPLIIGLGLASCNREEQKPCGTSEYFEQRGYEVRISNFDYDCDGVIDRREIQVEPIEFWRTE